MKKKVYDELAKLTLIFHSPRPLVNIDMSKLTDKQKESIEKANALVNQYVKKYGNENK